MVSFPLGTEMFYFPRCANLSQAQNHYALRIVGFPIRTSPDQRLLSISPKRFAAMLRPSSLCCVKASTIRPYISIRKYKNHNHFYLLPAFHLSSWERKDGLLDLDIFWYPANLSPEKRPQRCKDDLLRTTFVIWSTSLPLHQSPGQNVVVKALCVLDSLRESLHFT